MQEKYKKSAGCNPNGNKRTARITSNATALRQKEDGSTYVATFEMKK